MANRDSRVSKCRVYRLTQGNPQIAGRGEDTSSAIQRSPLLKTNGAKAVSSGSAAIVGFDQYSLPTKAVITLFLALSA